MNYVRHLNAALERFAGDERLRTTHISLYLALFHHWNAARFQNPLSVSRTELMRVSKVGSAKTYTDCLKDLHAWGYLEYLPSFNPTKGSLVRLCCFDTEAQTPQDANQHPMDKAREPVQEPNLYSYDTSSVQVEEPNLYTSDPGSGQGSGAGSAQAGERVVIPYINMKNDQTCQTSKTIQKVYDEPPQGKGSSLPDVAAGLAEKKEKVALKRKKKSESMPPPETTFADSPYAEVETFRQAFAGSSFEGVNLDFYHQALGNWRDRQTGDPPRRKDWLATARTFMLNDYKEGKLVTQRSHGPSTQPKAGKADISLEALFALTAAAHSSQ